MPVFRVGGKLVEFVHVPKAAGTAVTFYLQERFGAPAFHNPAYAAVAPLRRWTRSSPQHIDAQARGLLFPKGFFDASFAVVRHPVARLRSVFLYHRDVEKALPEGISFTGWLRDLPKRRREDPFWLDNHPRPMAEMVPEGSLVFRLEDGLEALIPWIDGLAGGPGGPARIGPLNVRTARLGPGRGHGGTLVPTNEDIALIARHFAEDFTRFGYDPEDVPTKGPSELEDTMTHSIRSEPVDFLVFGKTGQVANELARRVPEATFLGRDAADLGDPAACAAAIRAAKPGAVINAAAYTAVDKAEEEEALATTVNGDAPAAMAQACAELGIPLVHISTDYVFDGSGTRPWTPADPTGPLGAYGRSKLKGEAGIRAAGGSYAILRTSWVFSAHGNNFVKTMLRLGHERDALSIVADQIGGPTAAADIATACLTLAQKLTDGQGASGTYHFAGTPDVSWAEFAREIFSRAGLTVAVTDIPSAAYPTPAERPKNSRMTCTALTAHFGIERPDWRKSLEKVLTDLGELAP